MLFVVVARMLLVGVFGVAGVAKFFDRAETREALRNFGAPISLATPLAILLPGSEVAVAAALLLSGSAWWGGLAALALLLIFICAIGINMARGRKPKCRCFGQLHSKPIGWSTLGRNTVLCGAAALVISPGRTGVSPSIISWVPEQIATYPTKVLLAAMLIIALQSLLLVQIMKQQGRMLRRLDIVEGQFTRSGSIRGLTVGAPAPAFALPNLKGETVTLDALLANGLPALLFFVDPKCVPCEALLPQLDRWQRGYGHKINLVSLTRGGVAANLAKIKHYQIGQILLQEDQEVDDLYKVEQTPTAVLIRADGTIGSPQAAGAEHLESLVAGIIGDLGASPLLMATPPKTNGHAAAGLLS